MAVFGSSVQLNQGTDVVSVEEKVTSAYFSDGATQLLGNDISTASLTETNEAYYYGISKKGSESTTEWHVAYGHIAGSGSLVETDTIGESQAVYNQFASLLLPPNEVSGGFFISRNNSLASVPTEAIISAGADREIFVLSAKRSNMLDRVNKKNWTVSLTGRNTAGAAVQTLHLTDDSVNDNPTATPVGDRYNIVSGAQGTIHSESSARTFGFFYPDQGVLVFSQQELSRSFHGSASGTATSASVFQNAALDSTVDVNHQFQGFHTGDLTGAQRSDADYKHALRFIHCLSGSGTGNALKFRDEEDTIAQQYFCRIPAAGMNFSNNPTFVSGSDNEIRDKSMWDNPTVYVTGVELYNSAGTLVAIGKTSTPIKKNFSSEATIKVKLTY